LIATLVSTIIVVIPLIAYNRACYGNFTGAYGLDFSAPFLPSLEGILFSPARGLLIYFPLTIFAIIGLAKALCQPTTHRTIYLVFVVFIGVGIASVAKWLMWWEA
jgi:hypothetical protein